MTRAETLSKLMGVKNKRLAYNPEFPSDSIVIGGYASTPYNDLDGDSIKGFEFSKVQPFLNGMYRNLMYEHTALQVGVIIDRYVGADCRLYETEIAADGLYVVAVIRNDAVYMERVRKEILSGKVSSFSIGAIKSDSGYSVHEVSICRTGKNPQARFSILHKG